MWLLMRIPRAAAAAKDHLQSALAVQFN